MPKIKYKYYPNRPAKLTAAFAEKEYDKLVARILEAEGASKPDKWLKLFADWNALKAYVDGEGSRLYYEYAKNMADTKIELSEKYYRENIEPIFKEGEYNLFKALIDSQYHKAITERYGKQLTVVAEMSLKPFAPINTKLTIKASGLEQKYNKIIALAKVRVQGEQIGLWQCRTFADSPDESIRKEAFLASRNWFLKNRQKLARIYSQLVSIRTQMAKNLGYKSYTPLGYLTMGRSDYGRDNVAEFRRLVLEYFVPLLHKLNKEHAEAIGKQIARPWDSYDPRTTLPMGIAPTNKQLGQAQNLFNALSPALGKHFKTMRDGKLIDLENRLYKRSGAFCINFLDTGLVAVLCNSIGDAEDVEVLIHETGHAIQCLESAHIEAVDIQHGTHDIAEINSMGMEFLSLPHITKFFSKENANKIQTTRWENSISTLCYVCLVDEFQHWVYDNPKASESFRDKKWGKLANKYLAKSDYSGIEQYRNLRWYAQGHIFTSPFYYIDYALAETIAMQLALLDSKNHKKAMEIYMEFCRLGGTKSFLEAIKHVGLRSPFDESLIKDLAKLAAKNLDL